MLARIAGKNRGRKPIFNEAGMDVILGMKIAGVPVPQIAREVGVSRATIYKYLAKCVVFRRIDRVAEVTSNSEEGRILANLV